MKLMFMHAAIKRAEAYLGLVMVIAVVAVMTEVMKMGHMVAVAEVFADLWKWLVHYVSDVASAEIGAVVLVRIFGALD